MPVVLAAILRLYVCPPFHPSPPPYPPSEWFLDPIAPQHLVPYLPAIYQALLLPARLLYHLMGPDKMRAFDKKHGVHVKSEIEHSFSHFISTLMTAAQFMFFSPENDGAGGEL